MPLVVDQLQLWIIGFKWAGLDPNRFWIRLPTPVCDNFSTVLEAILSGHLECATLASEKYAGDDPKMAPFYIRYWIGEVRDAVNGQAYNRKLLKHVVIERWAFKDWCERRSIPSPEFWFPGGWTDYRWPEDDPPAPQVVVSLPRGEEGTAANEATSEISESKEAIGKLRDVTRFRIASQVIAEAVWKQQPDMTIAAMVQHDLVQNYGGAKHYGEESVRRWIKLVAPATVSAKRGRPKKQYPTKDE